MCYPIHKQLKYGNLTAELHIGFTACIQKNEGNIILFNVSLQNGS